MFHSVERIVVPVPNGGRTDACPGRAVRKSVVAPSVRLCNRHGHHESGILTKSPQPLTPGFLVGHLGIIQDGKYLSAVGRNSGKRNVGNSELLTYNSHGEQVLHSTTAIFFGNSKGPKPKSRASP
jgi:hypothetical protein